MTSKPYQQGFNESTGDIIVVCSPDDVQAALAEENSNGEKMTITREKAIELMKANEEGLTYAYHHGWDGEWMLSIQDVLEDEVTDADRTEKVVEP